MGAATITVTATDKGGSNQSASQQFVATVQRPPGVFVTPNALNLAEGSSGSYKVVLHSPPTDTVTVTPTVPADTDVSVNPSSLVFSTGTWGTAQTVTVQTFRDSDAMTDAPVTISHTVTGGDYQDLSVYPLIVNISETDVRGVRVSETAMQIEEGSSKRYKVVLNSQPSHSVEVGVRVDQQRSDVSIDKDSLTFTPQDWSQDQEVEVSVADDDDVAQASSVTIRHTARGGDYASFPVPPVTVIPVENDQQTLLVNVPRAVESAGALVFEVRPRSQTTAEMTVEYRTKDANAGPGSATAGTDYTATGGSLTFPVGTTRVQTIEVPLVDDSVDEAEIETFVLLLKVTSPTTQELTSIGTIEDDDEPSVVVSFGGGSYEVTEGASVKITAKLSVYPERLIQIPLVKTHHGGATELDYYGLPENLVFSSSETTQTITFTAVDDHEDDDGEAVVLSLGTLPDGVTGSYEATLAIRDNDGSSGSGGGGGGGSGGPAPGDDDEDDEDDDSGGGSGGSGGLPPQAGFEPDYRVQSEPVSRTHRRPRHLCGHEFRYGPVAELELRRRRRLAPAARGSFVVFARLLPGHVVGEQRHQRVDNVAHLPGRGGRPGGDLRSGRGDALPAGFPVRGRCGLVDCGRQERDGQRGPRPHERLGPVHLLRPAELGSADQGTGWLRCERSRLGVRRFDDRPRALDPSDRHGDRCAQGVPE